MKAARPPFLLPPSTFHPQPSTRSWLAWAAAALLLLLSAGCEINVTPSDAERLADGALEKYDKPALHVERYKVTFAGANGGREAVCRQSKFGATRYLYEFEGADRGRSSVFWDDRMLNWDAGARYAEEFPGLPRPTRDELRELLLTTLRRRLGERTSTFSTGRSWERWKTYHLIEVPREPSDVARRTEFHWDTATGATVMFRETDEKGAVVRELQALELSGPPTEPKEPPRPDFPVTVVFRLPGAQDRAPAGKEAPKAVLDCLGGPRYASRDGIDCWDFTRRGFVLALWSRPAPAGKDGAVAKAGFVSPLAATLTAAGTEVRWWWCGLVMVHRWTAGGREFTIATNLPPDMAKQFIEANAGWWKPSGSGDSVPESGGNR